MALSAQLWRLSAERHRLELDRDGRFREIADLETRSFLVHDLTHWCVEAAAGLDDGFWGLLARGVRLATLGDRLRPPGGYEALELVETVVGPMQTFLNHGRAEAIDHLLERPVARWVTRPFVAAASGHFKSLMGAWKATPFGGALVLRWPPEPAQVLRPRA